MKFSIFNALTTITIVALTIALIVNHRQDRKVIIEGHDFFESLELFSSLTKRSTWEDRTAPPPVLPNTVKLGTNGPKLRKQFQATK